MSGTHDLTYRAHIWVTSREVELVLLNEALQKKHPRTQLVVLGIFYRVICAALDTESSDDTMITC